jgi:capsular exopolysaccharide synthesis family protein
MSRIFEAFKLTEGDIAGQVLPDLGGGTADAAPAPAPVADAPVPAAQPSAPGKASQPAPPPFLKEPPAGPAFSRVLRLEVPELSPVLPFDDTNFRASEQYRIIRTRIIQHESDPRVIVVSSPGTRDGKSLTALNLAGALSLKATARVLLIDTDFRRPSIHIQIGFPESPGLADVFEGKCRLEEAIIRTVQFPSLHVLTAGERRANPAELLDSPQWDALCARFREMFEYVILDSPPMAAVADYDLIQAVCDGVIVVVRPDHTNRKACFELIDKVPKNKLLGVLMNCVPEWLPSRANSYEPYYYRRP